MANEVELKKVCKAVFNITYERYMQLAREDLVPRPDRGKIDFIAASKALIAYYRKLAETHGELSLSDERTAWTMVRKEREKLKLETERGNLVPVDQAKIWLAILVGEARLALMGLPRRLAGTLILKTDERDVEAELRTEITKILRELTKPLTRRGRKYGRRRRNEVKDSNGKHPKMHKTDGPTNKTIGESSETLREIIEIPRQF